MRTTLLTVLIGLTMIAPAALAARDDAALVVPAGETHLLATGVLDAAGDVVVDGTLMAPPGVGLVLRVGGDLFVNGVVQAGHGSFGADGGDLAVVAQRLVVAEGARVAAGGGGYGAHTFTPGAAARGQDGGDGGSVIILADATLTGALMPGNGGNGGDAAGATAIGGDAGDAGTVTIDGDLFDYAQMAVSPVLPEAPEGMRLTSGSCQSTTALGLPGSTGANGGNACALGTNGGGGAVGADGQDDATIIDNAARPDCPAYAPGDQDVDGEQAQNGFPGGLGGSATATGGAGGNVASTSALAGNGGTATADGGEGGQGGTGGFGGHSNGFGAGCKGGDGGAGGAGGNAVATGGAQGLSPLNCGNNGAPGAHSATKGFGGAGGWGMQGGGDNQAPDHQGPHGANGVAGPHGTASSSAPAAIPCLAPDAPTVFAFDDIFTCDVIRLKITQPSFNGNSAVLSYDVFRKNATTFWTQIATVTWTSPVQINNFGGHAPGTQYDFKVIANTAVGSSAFSTVSSTTPDCLALVAGPSIPIQLFDPCAPSVVALPSVGSTTLIITAPATPSGTPLSYEVWRGPGPNAESFLATTAYGSPTVSYLDIPVTSGVHWYNVTLVTTTTRCTSNHAMAVVPAMAQTHGGVGTATRTIGKLGAAGTSTSCSNVPINTEWVFHEGTFRFAANYRQGTGAGRTDDPAVCAGTPGASRAYGEGSQRGASCAEDIGYEEQGVYNILRTCEDAKGLVQETVRIGRSATGRWNYVHEIKHTTKDGSYVNLRIAGALADDPAGAVSSRARAVTSLLPRV